MADDLSIDSLRGAIRRRRTAADGATSAGLEATARRFEAAVAQLTRELLAIVDELPELEVTLEDEVEAFTSPAHPGESVTVRDQRICITGGEDFLLFDPTSKAHFTTVGQVDVRSSRPIPFLMEKTLYLSEAPGSERFVWGFRSLENLGGGLTPFDRQSFLRMLGAVFA